MKQDENLKIGGHVIMNKKRFLAALAVATRAFSLVGCGSSGGGDSKGSDSGVANKDKPL